MFIGRDLLLLGAFKPLSGSGPGLSHLLWVYVCGTTWKDALANCKLHTAENHKPLISTTCCTHLALNSTLVLSLFGEKSQLSGQDPDDPWDATHLVLESCLRLVNSGVGGYQSVHRAWHLDLEGHPCSQTFSQVWLSNWWLRAVRWNPGCLVKFEFG